MKQIRITFEANLDVYTLLVDDENFGAAMSIIDELNKNHHMDDGLQAILQVLKERGVKVIVLDDMFIQEVTFLVGNDIKKTDVKYEFAIYRGMGDRIVVSYEDMFTFIHERCENADDDPIDIIEEMFGTGSCKISDENYDYVVAIEPVKEE